MTKTIQAETTQKVWNDERTFEEKLISIQSELKAPKNQKNNFGNYKYRSCEDILEAVKPLLVKEGLLLTLNDELVMVGDRYYIKTTAKLVSKNSGCLTTAYAREEETKKGMDSSQITGAASSYARKYALNAMFLIDDNKDSDNTSNGMQTGKKEAPKPTTDSNVVDGQSKLQLAINKMQEKIANAPTLRELEKLRLSIKKARENNILNDEQFGYITNLFIAKEQGFTNGQTTSND